MTTMLGNQGFELQALLDAAVDAIVIIDHNGYIEAFNPGAERLFGYPADKVKGQSITMLMPEAERADHDKHLLRHRLTGEARIIGTGRDVRAQRADGTVFIARLSVGQIHGAYPHRYIGILHDLTAQLRDHEDLARERDRANQYLIEAREAHERMMHVSRLATMGEMASGISHEINQPLAAISASAQAAMRMLAMPQPNIADVNEALALVSSQAQRAGEIILRLRRLGRDQRGQREPRQLNELVEELGPLTRADTALNGVQVQLQLAPGLPKVAVDGIQIQQVLLNLISNAVQELAAVPGNERRITIATEAGPDDTVVTRITDTGRGIAPEIRNRLFEPFVTTKPEGTGLGLPISRTIIQAHGGTLEYERAQPSGATFRFTLPAVSAAA